MKKSKIIVPALAMIAFSAAASIAGSVAWFTASRQFTMDAGTYAVVKTNANLQCVVTAGIGTYKTGDNAIAVKGGADAAANKLSDGSFNHKTEKIYTPNANGDGFATTNGEVTLAAALADPAKVERGNDAGGGKIYTAVTFNLAFTVSFGSVNGNVGLYLDNTQSDTDDPATGASKFAVSGDAAPVTAKGFRMAFVPHDIPEGSTGHTTVFADLQVADNCKHVNDATKFPVYTPASGLTPASWSEGAAAYGASSAHDLIDSSYKAALPAEESAASAANTTDRPDYLGTFKFTASTQVTLNYTVVAWFEGTDPEIVNRNLAAEYQSVVSTLAFKTVKFAA